MGVSLLALAAVGAVSAAPAGAWEEEPKAPQYSISVVEGVTTQPEESVLSTSASARVPHNHHVQLTLRIVHNGLTVAQDTESNGNAWLSQVPQVGDVVYLEVPTGNVVGSVVYDGLPSMDPTVCAGSTNFSGQRSAGQEVEGSYETLVAHPNYTAHRHGESAQVTALTGSSFSGSFLKPLALGETVKAVEHLQTPLAGGALFTSSSENDRPVAACPVPPTPPVLPVVALQGSVSKLRHASVHGLLKHGWQTWVSINQAGTITEDLYAQGGALPAFASSKGKHHKQGPAPLLARGTAQASGAGTIPVALHLTPKGRALLKRHGRIKAVLVTTLRTASGAELNLSPRSVSLGA